MSFLGKIGNDFLNGFLSVSTLKDFSHASKVFRSNGFELAPKLKFLYHVYFDLNKTDIPALYAKYDAQSQIDLGLLVKEVKLPSYEIKTDTLNQYNRKRIVQTNIEYSDVTLTMHDDGANLSRNLWYDYLTYYFRDSTYAFEGMNGTEERNPGFRYGERDIYKDVRAVNDWGYSGDGSNDQGGFGVDSSKPHFFRSIKIFGMDKRHWVCYVLVNPHITSFQHDTYNYSEAGGIMANTMTLKYETVKYYEGVLEGTSGAPIDGFGQPSRYDTAPSSLGTAGSQPTVLGQGGLLSAGQNIIGDLANGNILGAVRTAGVSYNTIKNNGLGNILKNEATQMGVDAIKQFGPQAGKFLTPTGSVNKTPTTTATQTIIPGQRS